MQDAFAYCAELVRTADRDSFIASLFAPAKHRGAQYFPISSFPRLKHIVDTQYKYVVTIDHIDVYKRK